MRASEHSDRRRSHAKSSFFLGASAVWPPRRLLAALTLDDSNVVLARQIKPKLGTISKISTEPDGRICGYRPASVQYVCDAAQGYAEI
jgi:hypothetical protein